MMKVSDAVRDVLRSSPFEYMVLQNSQLNLSAFAASIHKKIEDTTKKPVKISTIITALSRIRRSSARDASLLPNVHIDDIAAKAGLMEMSFEKTRESLLALQKFSRCKIDSSEFFMITQGVAEITLIVPQQWEASIRSCFHGVALKIMVPNLASLTIRFHERYMTEPNMFFAILSKFAMDRMEIVEMVSTFTEINFILHEKDVERAFGILRSFLSR